VSAGSVPVKFTETPLLVMLTGVVTPDANLKAAVAARRTVLVVAVPHVPVSGGDTRNDASADMQLLEQSLRLNNAAPWKEKDHAPIGGVPPAIEEMVMRNCVLPVCHANVAAAMATPALPEASALILNMPTFIGTPLVAALKVSVMVHPTANTEEPEPAQDATTDVTKGAEVKVDTRKGNE